MSLQFSCFVTGTDTDVGKTLVAAALLRLCCARAWRSVGMKPVAAGVEMPISGTEPTAQNADVLQLIAAGNLSVPPQLINPYLFSSAIAPHIAAAQAGVPIDCAVIVQSFEDLLKQTDAEAVIVEGAGGFLVPLGEQCDMGDLAQRLALPLVLVVGMRLGCLNHALLTQEAILARGLKLAAWVANRIDPQMTNFDENLVALQQRLKAPLLGVLPHFVKPDVDAAAACLRLPSDC